MEQDTTFRGSAPAKIDDKGRLKIPSIFRGVFAAFQSREVFVTSEWGDHVQIYPLPAWIEIEKRVNRHLPAPEELEKYVRNVNHWGQMADIDGQDRVLIHPHLREKAGTTGEVYVQAGAGYLAVWDRERHDRDMVENPYTKEDKRRMTALLSAERTD
jgi:MraZ protein